MIAINAGLTILHVATGAFFVTTGYRKCFLPDVRAKVCDLITGKGVPLVAAHAVIAGEFLGGLGLLFGALTHLAALGLLIIMLGAYKTDTWPGVLAKDPPPYRTWAYRSKLVSNALCTPEFQLIVILAAMALMGAGAWSIDGLLF